MKVLFINPPFLGKFSRTSRSPAVTRAGTIYYPFWSAYTAGVLDKAGFQVKFVDAPAENLSLDEVKSIVKEFSPELVVVDTSTPSIYSDAKAAEEIKNIMPKTFVVLVGTHPSALPVETLKLSEKIDGVTKGEYDYTIRDLAICLRDKGDLRTVKGLVFKKDGQILENEPRPVIENVDELPFVTEVYKKFFDIRKYFFAASDYPMVMIITGRGCPYRCFFCLYPQTFHGRRYRFRGAESVVNEFEYIAKNLPEVKEIGIEDDTFTVDKKRVQKICQMILEKKIRLKWYCNVRVDLDLETMKWMKKAGCRLVTVGFESGDDKILENIRKGITVEQIREFVKNTKKAKILVHGCFMAGNPGETKETLEKMLKFAKELNCDTIQFYPLIVYPGTEAFQWAKENNFLSTFDFRKWATEGGGYSSLLNLPGLTTREIVEYCNRANKEYYLRLPYILLKLKLLFLQPSEAKRTIKGAISFFKFTFLSKNY